jgi:hypothetical protein
MVFFRADTEVSARSESRAAGRTHGSGLRSVGFWASEIDLPHSRALPSRLLFRATGCRRGESGGELPGKRRPRHHTTFSQIWAMMMGGTVLQQPLPRSDNCPFSRASMARGAAKGA